MIFRQYFDRNSCTYTYLLGCEETKEAVLIDSVDTLVSRDLKHIKELGLKLKYTLETHIHADHVTGGEIIRKKLGIETVISKHPKVTFKGAVEVGEGSEIKFGKEKLTVLETPGHTACSISFIYKNKMIFTGDAIFVRGCGRSDFQGGSPSILYDSIQKIFKTLPDDCEIYPGHDYKGNLKSTVGEEKKFNPRIGNGQTKEGFSKIMNSLNLSYPGKLDISVPANRNGGVYPDKKATSLIKGLVSCSAALKQHVIGDMVKNGLSVYVQLRQCSENDFDKEDPKQCFEKEKTKYVHYPVCPKDIMAGDNLEKLIREVTKEIGGTEKEVNFACASATRARVFAICYIALNKEKLKIPDDFNFQKEIDQIGAEPMKKKTFDFVYALKKY